MPFLILIHRLCVETKVEVLLYLDPLLAALHNMDPGLIKNDENPVAIQWVLPPPMHETFMLDPYAEGSTAAATTTSTATTIEEGPYKHEAVDIKIGPTIATPIPEPSTS